MTRINRFFLSLGSNISPEKNLRLAIQALEHYGTITAVSSVWQTPPVGYPDQPDYLNAVVLLQSAMSPTALQKTAIPTIEADLGRVRTENKFGPRTIDIDIMLVNDEVLTVEHRPIPSPEILERSFVAIPLAEIAPAFRHPATGERLDSIAAGFAAERRSMLRRADIDLGDLPLDAQRETSQPEL